MSLTFKGKFGPVTGTMKTGDAPSVTPPYEYLIQFDLTTVGAGVYSNNNTTVSGLSSSTNSKQSFRNTAPADEIRLRFSNDAGSFGRIFIYDDNGNYICDWNDNGDVFSYFPVSGSAATATGFTPDLGTSPAEFRLNTTTYEVSLYASDVLVGTVTNTPFSSDYFYCYTREGSSGSQFTLLPDPN